MSKKVKLKEQKRILEDNIKEEEGIVENNESRVGLDGKTYTAEHYKEAMKHDKEELKRVNSEIKQKQKIEALKKAETAARNNINEDISSKKELNSENPVYSQGSLRNPTELKQAKKKKIELVDLSRNPKD